LNYRWIRNPQQKNSSTTNFQWRVYQWFRKYNLILDRIFYRWKTILWKKFIIKIILYFIYFFLSRYLNTIIYLSSIFVLMKHNHIKNTIHISTSKKKKKKPSSTSIHLSISLPVKILNVQYHRWLHHHSS
jgi:hypothetical protein